MSKNLKEFKNSLKYQRQSPQKLMRLANLVRSKSINYSLSQLNNLPHKGASLLHKMLKSVYSNAKNMGYDANNLVVSNIQINKGPYSSRFKPRARGRIDRITKKTSHIKIVATLKD